MEIETESDKMKRYKKIGFIIAKWVNRGSAVCSIVMLLIIVLGAFNIAIPFLFITTTITMILSFILKLPPSTREEVLEFIRNHFNTDAELCSIVDDLSQDNSVLRCRRLTRTTNINDPFNNSTSNNLSNVPIPNKAPDLTDEKDDCTRVNVYVDPENNVFYTPRYQTNVIE